MAFSLQACLPFEVGKVCEFENWCGTQRKKWEIQKWLYGILGLRRWERGILVVFSRQQYKKVVWKSVKNQCNNLYVSCMLFGGFFCDQNQLQSRALIVHFFVCRRNHIHIYKFQAIMKIICKCLVIIDIVSVVCSFAEQKWKKLFGGNVGCGIF